MGTQNYGKKHPLVFLSKTQSKRITTFNNRNNSFAFTAYNGEYALCTTASCIQLQNGTLACECDVRNGNAAGLKTNTSLNPFTLNNANFVFSLYSGVNSNEIIKQNCTSGTWGDCLNKLCIKTSPVTATCFCAPQTTKNWITFQYNNNPCSCNNLSGALNPVYMGIERFYKKL